MLTFYILHIFQYTVLIGFNCLEILEYKIPVSF